MGQNSYCAVVKYNGTFHAVAGQTSPQQSGTLTGEEHGKFSGGYQTTTFTGTLSVNDPTHWPLKGQVHPKPVDYQCDISGYCPGFIDWSGKYFTNLNNFAELVWGWKYIASDRDDGVWVNASTGNSGDILDKD
jgi:hypothetical protein